MPLDVRPLASGDLDTVADWLAHVLAPAQSGELLALLRRPRIVPLIALIAELGGTLIGCALARYMRLRLGPAVLICGDLNIAVPDGESTTIAALVEQAVPLLYDQGAAFVLTRGAGPTVREYGFAAFRFDTRVTLPGAATGAALLRPPTPADLDDLAALYDATYRPLDLSEVRASLDWHAWPSRGSALLLDDSSGRLVGYAWLEHGVIVEAAVADAGVARTLAASLIPERPTLALGLTHPLTHAAIQLGGVLQVRSRQHASEALLAGVLSLARALEQLAPAIEWRLADSHYAGWTGSVAIESAAESAILQIKNGRIAPRTENAAPDIRLRRIGLPALAQLLLGYRAAADLRATGELDCDDIALGLLNVIFPTLGV